jgi:hypothetical protein
MQRSVEIRMGVALQSMMSSQIGNYARAGAGRVVETAFEACLRGHAGRFKRGRVIHPLEVHAPESKCPLPRELGGLPLMGIGPLLVHEAVLGIVTEYLG